MNFSVTLLESSDYIQQQILEACKNQIDKSLSKTINTILPKIKTLLIDALRAEPEYQSLIGGQLKLEFGIPNSSSIDAIVEKLANTLEIEKIPLTIKNTGLSGGFSLTALKTDNMDGLIADEAAMVIDTERGYSLPWLQWLLYEGNKPIVRNYEVSFGPNKNSRTGQAIMVTSKNNWRVPPAFAGTSSHNWTTRAVDRIQDQIPVMIQKMIEDNL